MPFIILANALLGLFVSLLYYPDSPLYIFPGAKLEEVWLWSKYSAFISALLFIFALLSVDTNIKGREIARSLSVFTSTLQGIMNLPPAALYLLFLHGSLFAKLTVRGNVFTLSSKVLFLHLAIIMISWTAAAWLAFGKKSRDLSERVRLMDSKTYLGEGI